MAALLRKALTQTALSVNGKHGIQFIRLASHWNKDWKPGPYPKTQAERAAAAKKYGLLLQDYEPYPEDGMGYGDYPKLPLVSNDQRDPFVNWDYPDMKRNFAEPVNYFTFKRHHTFFRNLIGCSSFCRCMLITTCTLKSVCPMLRVCTHVNKCFRRS